MTDLSGLTEFIDLDVSELHFVSAGASGFPPIVAKSAVDQVNAVLAETGDLTKARWEGFCSVRGCSVCKEKFGPMFEGLIEKAKLKSKARNALPSSAFALPESREYPIHDLNHARAALSDLHNASSSEQSKIKAAVHRRYPEIKSEDDEMSKTAKVAGKPQSSEEDGSTPPASSVEGQSHELHPGAGPNHMDNQPDDGGDPKHPGFSGSGAPTANQEGHGSTAPDKVIPKGQALSQTHAVGRKEDVGGEGDGRGDVAPNGNSLDDESKREAASQTEAVSRKEAPGSPGWEHVDANLAGRAGSLISEALSIIDKLGDREKAEIGTGTTASLKPNGMKGTDVMSMSSDELFKLLDERDALKAAQAKKDAKAEKKKADAKMKAKMKMKDDKAMPDGMEKGTPEHKAWKAEREAAKTAGAPDLSEVTKVLGTLGDTLAAVSERVEKIAAQPMPPRVLNGAGIAAAGGAAALRQADSTGAFAGLEKAVVDALDGTTEDLQKAAGDLSAGRLIAFERMRAAGIPQEEARKRVLGTNAVKTELLKHSVVKGIPAQPKPAPLPA